MISLQRCTDELGYRLMNMRLKLNNHKKRNIQRQLHAAASFGKKTAAVYLDDSDVAAINVWKRERDPTHTACSLVVARGGILYYANFFPGSDQYQQWYDVLSRENPLQCMVCFEEKRDSLNVIVCETCRCWFCDICNRQMPGNECPFCRQYSEARNVT